MDLCDPDMVPCTISMGNYSAFQGVLIKSHFLTKFSHLEKFADLMKDLKYEHQSIFPCGGG